MTFTLTKVFLLTGGIAVLLTAIRYIMRRPISLPVALVQNFVGAFFIFSGAVKAIDPMGTAIKMGDYLIEFGLYSSLASTALPAAVIMIVLEIVLGITLILGFRRNITMWLLLLLIIFFTFLTGFAHFADKIKDCGCFGDFLKIPAKASFMKDVFLLALIGFLFVRKKYIEPLFSALISGPITGIALVGLTLFCLNNFLWNEPIFDFRPYKIGNNLREMMIEVPDVVEQVWVYKDKATGKEQEFTKTEYFAALKDPNFKQKWQYVENRDKIIKEGIDPKIEVFQMLDEQGNDIGTEVLTDSTNYQFLVIISNLKKADVESFAQLNAIAEGCAKEAIPFRALSYSGKEDNKAFKEKHNIKFDFYWGDDKVTKTITRSNPGLLLIKDGVVKGKWHHNHFPTFEELKKDYLK